MEKITAEKLSNKFFTQNVRDSTIICSTPYIRHGKFEISFNSIVKKHKSESPKGHYESRQYEGTPVRHIPKIKPKHLNFNDSEDSASSEDTTLKPAENALVGRDTLKFDEQVIKRKRLLSYYSFNEEESDDELCVKCRRISISEEI